jgi:hypothetical protein
MVHKITGLLVTSAWSNPCSGKLHDKSYDGIKGKWKEESINLWVERALC